MATVKDLADQTVNGRLAVEDSHIAQLLIDARWNELLGWISANGGLGQIPEVRTQVEAHARARDAAKDAHQEAQDVRSQAIDLGVAESLAVRRGYALPQMKIEEGSINPLLPRTHVTKNDIGRPTGIHSPPMVRASAKSPEVRVKNVPVSTFESEHPVATFIDEHAPHAPPSPTADPYFGVKAIGVGALGLGTVVGASVAKADTTRVGVAIVGTVATAAAAWLSFRPGSPPRDPHIGRGGGSGSSSGHTASGLPTGGGVRTSFPAASSPRPAPAASHPATPAPAGTHPKPRPQQLGKEPTPATHVSRTPSTAPPTVPRAPSAPSVPRTPSTPSTPTMRPSTPSPASPPSSAPHFPPPIASSPSAPVSGAPVSGAPNGSPVHIPPPSGHRPGFGPGFGYGPGGGFGFEPSLEPGFEVVTGGCRQRVELVRTTRASRLFRGPADLVLEAPTRGCLLEERDGFARVRWDGSGASWCARSAIVLIVRA